MENRKPESILDSLDGVKRSPAPDFFYTRLRARMESAMEVSIPKPASLLRPVWVMAVLTAVVAINLFVFLSNSRPVTAQADETENLSQTIAGDISIADNNIIYDLNQDR